MYDELVEDLRRMANTWLAEEYKVCAEAVRFLTREAAEAIEELSEYINTIRRLKCEGWYLQQTKYHDGYHAVSTMPLPQPPKGE